MVLKVNAIFSLTTGLFLIINPKLIASLLAIESADVMLVIGYGLLIFASTLYYVIKKELKNRKVIDSIIISDLVWVVGSLILVIFQPITISTVGNVLISVIAVIILSFALIQTKYRLKS